MQEKKTEQIYEKVKLRKELNYLLENLSRERKKWNLYNYSLLCTYELSEEASDCLREIIAEKIYCIDCELEDI